MQQTRSARAEKAMHQNPDLRWVDQITHLMDNRFRLPGTNYRFGLDPILGLLPGVGDAVSLAISGILISYMYRHGASRKAIIMMVGNVVLDATIGSIPILGNIFDFAFKANDRNIRIMKRHFEEGKYRGSGKGLMIGIGIAIFAIIALILWIAWQLLTWFFGLL